MFVANRDSFPTAHGEIRRNRTTMSWEADVILHVYDFVKIIYMDQEI